MPPKTSYESSPEPQHRTRPNRAITEHAGALLARIDGDAAVLTRPGRMLRSAVPATRLRGRGGSGPTAPAGYAGPVAENLTDVSTDQPTDQATDQPTDQATDQATDQVALL